MLRGTRTAAAKQGPESGPARARLGGGPALGLTQFEADQLVHRLIPFLCMAFSTAACPEADAGASLMAFG